MDIKCRANKYTGIRAGYCLLIYKTCKEEERQIFDQDINNSVVSETSLSPFKGNVCF